MSDGHTPKERTSRYSRTGCGSPEAQDCEPGSLIRQAGPSLCALPLVSPRSPWVRCCMWAKGCQRLLAGVYTDIVAYKVHIPELS